MAETRSSDTAANKIAQITQIMEKAQAALQRNAWFEAERLAARALDAARTQRAFGLMARILLPLQEARRQRLQLAFDAAGANGITIVESPFDEEFRPQAGCYLVQPPMVGADARRLRLAALEQQVPVAVLCREPLTRARLCPIVAIGQVTIRTKVDPPKTPARPTLAWFAAAMEALGDAAIETLDTGLSIARLDAWPDHEKLHQALAEACRRADRAIAAGRAIDDRNDDEIEDDFIDGEFGDEER
jgi:hypothetical protein